MAAAVIGVILGIWAALIVAILVVNHLVHRNQPPTPRPPLDTRPDEWFTAEFAHEAHARAKREAQARRVYPSARPDDAA